MRAAHCFDASMVVLGGSRPKLYLRKIPTDVTKTWKHVPVVQIDDPLSVVPFDAEVVAVEIVDDAKELSEFHHPERAFYLFGPEDGSIPKEVLATCSKHVKIDTKYCLNLGATVNVVLYDRLAKEQKNGKGAYG